MFAECLQTSHDIVQMDDDYNGICTQLENREVHKIMCIYAPAAARFISKDLCTISQFPAGSACALFKLSNYYKYTV